MTALYIGVLSGTCADSVDAAAFSFADGCRLVASHKSSLPEYFPGQIASIQSEMIDIAEYAELGVQIGRWFAGAVNALIESHGLRHQDIMAVGMHGQTIMHRPFGKSPFSLQLGDPSVVAAQTGLAVVADFRSADVALGGEGAPLAPAFHQAFLAPPDEACVVVNIGGIANISAFGATGALVACDVGPGNILMNDWTRRHLELPFDSGGAWAASAPFHDGLLHLLLQKNRMLCEAQKSLCASGFDASFLEACLASCPVADAAVVQSTLCEFTARSIADAVEQLSPERAARVFLCGGGAHNMHLLLRLSALLPQRQVATTREVGIDPDWVEAGCFAWLAQRRLGNLTGNLPEVTGASRKAVLGAVYDPCRPL